MGPTLGTHSVPDKFPAPSPQPLPRILNPLDRQEPASRVLLEMIAVGAIVPNSHQRLARLKRTLARYTESCVREAVRIKFRLEIGMHGLKGKTIDGTR